MRMAQVFDEDSVYGNVVRRRRGERKTGVAGEVRLDSGDEESDVLAGQVEELAHLGGVEALERLAELA